MHVVWCKTEHRPPVAGMRDSKGPLPATSNLDLYSNGTAIGTNFGRQELVPGAFCVWFGAEGGREGGDGGRNKLGVAPQMHGTHMKGGVGVPDGSPLSLSLSQHSGPRLC